MKFLTRLFFYTFVFTFFSCDPDGLPTDSNKNEVKPSSIIKAYGDTGGNEGDIIDGKTN